MSRNVLRGVRAPLSFFALCGIVVLSGCRTSVEENPESAPPEVDPATVVLSPEQLALAGIHTAPVAEQPLQPWALVPGRLRYDATRHIEIRIPTAGVLTKVNVLPGAEVNGGDVLAEISSAELGKLRADLLQHQAAYELALRASEWEQLRQTGMSRLVELIQQGAAPDEIEGKLSDVTLGALRNDITSAYLRLRLAANLAASVENLSGGSALPQREVQQRLNERDLARAALDAVLEQSLYEARIAREQSRQAADDALRRVRIDEEQLRSILGVSADEKLYSPDQPLSLVEVRAPFAGTIEACPFAQSERVEAQAALFVLADTTRLWVAADVRERQWAALDVQLGQELQVKMPASESSPLTARVVYLGREVDPATNAMPLFAEIDNSAGALRPGQYASVRIPLGQPMTAAAIPETAVLEHEGRKFVFVAMGNSTYRRVDVDTGGTDGELVEIRGGLQPGDEVVTAGGFVLKSQLLLATEEE